MSVENVQTLAPQSAVRFIAMLSGLLLLTAILVLGWRPEAATGELGGAYSAGHGLWGVGVRLPWIVPMVIMATSAVVIAGALGRSRIAATIGVASILLVVAVGRGGVGYVCAIAAACTLVLTGLLVAIMAQSSGIHSVQAQEAGLR
jgi:hypothetical protein